MLAVRIVQWIARIAGVGALTLGLLFWIFDIDLISLHMLFGLTLALALLILSVVLLFSRGIRVWGAAGIVYSLILPTFGLTQARLLPGSTHWLIESAHLLVGLGALVLVQLMETRYQRLKLPTSNAVTRRATAPQVGS